MVGTHIQDSVKTIIITCHFETCFKLRPTMLSNGIFDVKLEESRKTQLFSVNRYLAGDTCLCSISFSISEMN